MSREIMATEAGMYWELVRDRQVLAGLCGPYCPGVVEIEEELQAIEMHSTWPRLQARIRRQLAAFEAERQWHANVDSGSAA